MVIMNSINEEVMQNGAAAGRKISPYVYLVDNEQKMMLILKRDLEEISENNFVGDRLAVQTFVTQKVKNLLDRISDNGPLSAREIEVLNYAAMGKSNKQIADLIGLSESTIKNHFSSTLRKLHANDRTHAVTLALCNGWISTKKISIAQMDEESAFGAID